MADKVSAKDLKADLYDVKVWVKDRTDVIEKNTITKMESSLKNHELLKKYDMQISELHDRAKSVENELERITKNLVERASDN